MLYRSVKRIKDLKFSAIGFGSWSLGSKSGWSGASDEASTKVIHAAIDNGITFFDTAPVYGFGTSEVVLGKAIKGKRDKIIIASKCGLIWDNSYKIRNDLSEKSVIAELDRSLERLGTEHIDIYQLHWPDPNIKTEELANTIEKLLSTKKIGYIGLSNFSLEDTRMLSKNERVATYQGLYNIFEQNENTYHNIPLVYKMKDEIMPFSFENGLAIFPYSPLMQGILTDRFDISILNKNDIRMQNPKFRSGVIEKYTEKSKMLKEYAKENGMTLTALAYGWMLYQNEITSVISGATKEQDILENIKYAEIQITKEMYDKINSIAAL